MRDKTNYLTYIIVIITLLGCAPRREISTTQRDTVTVELRPRKEVIHDTITIEIERLRERVEVRQDSSRLENRYALSEAIILPSGKLRHTLESRPQTIVRPIEHKIELRDSIIYHHRYTEEVEIREVERELTRWQRLQMNGFWILLALFIIYFVLGTLFAPLLRK